MIHAREVGKDAQRDTKYEEKENAKRGRKRGEEPNGENISKSKQATRSNLVDDVSLAKVITEMLLVVEEVHFPQSFQLVVEADDAPILANYHKTLLLTWGNADASAVAGAYRNNDVTRKLS